MPRIYVDFHNTSSDGGVRLNTVGTIKDLNEQGLVLEPGAPVCIYSEDFEGPGVIAFDEEERVWTARFNWDDMKHVAPGA